MYNSLANKKKEKKNKSIFNAFYLSQYVLKHHLKNITKLFA